MNDDHVEKRMVMNDETHFLHSCIEELIVSDESCNGREWRVLELSLIPTLTVLQVGDACFKNVKEVKLIGMKKLERVVIGNGCFIRNYASGSSHHFYLKDCPQVKELKIGRYSFEKYSVCEIENMPSLEVIEMGELNEESCNFYKASLELKSAGDGMK